MWRWDKKEPVLRFPLKDPPSCLRLGNNLCVAGAKGRINLWEPLTGRLLGEIEAAHYMDISDMDLSSAGDLLLTGGRDSKVKLWIVQE